MTAGQLVSDHAFMQYAIPLEVLFALVTIVSCVLALYGTGGKRS
jgi:hypothetical protein